jgi:hypothetical protein
MSLYISCRWPNCLRIRWAVLDALRSMKCPVASAQAVFDRVKQSGAVVQGARGKTPWRAHPVEVAFAAQGERRAGRGAGYFDATAGTVFR